MTRLNPRFRIGDYTSEWIGHDPRFFLRIWIGTNREEDRLRRMRYDKLSRKSASKAFDEWSLRIGSGIVLVTRLEVLMSISRRAFLIGSLSVAATPTLLVRASQRSESLGHLTVFKPPT
jgi:hypothetical protein